MAMIYGHFGDRKKNNKFIDQVKDILSCHGHFHSKTFEKGMFAYGVVQPKNESKVRMLYDPQKEITAVVSGRVYESGGILVSDDAQCVMEAYLAYGYNFAHTLRGVFVSMIHDHKKNEIIISNDHFGLQPCYYYSDNGCLYISSEPEVFVSCGIVQPELDNDALAELFLIGSPLSNRTLFKKINRLTPATTIVYQNGAIRMAIRDRFRKNIAGKTMLDWCEDVDYLLRKSVEQILHYVADESDAMELALSGGIDSRVILAYLVKLGADFKAITCFDPNATHKDDVNYALLLSKKFGFEHTVYEKLVGSATGFKKMLQPISRNFNKPLEINGYAGEVLKGEYFKRVNIREPHDSEKRLKKIFQKEFIRTLSANPNETAVLESSKNNFPSIQKNREIFYVDRLGAMFRHEQPPAHRPKHLYLNNAHHPFLNYDLIEYITDIPMENLQGKKFLIEFMQKRYPEYMQVPCTTIDRLGPSAKETYDARDNRNLNQYRAYFDSFKEFSPLWQLPIFTGDYYDKHHHTLACILTVWHDFYFGYRDSIEKMKQFENAWLNLHPR